MAEVQVEFTSEEEARIKWENLLLGKTHAVVKPTPATEELIDEPVIEPAIIVMEDSPEAVLSQLFKSMVKGIKD